MANVWNSLTKTVHWLPAPEAVPAACDIRLHGAKLWNVKLHCRSVFLGWVHHGKPHVERSLPACLPDPSCPPSPTDNCSDLNSELQRVLTGLENVVCCRKKSSCSLSVAEVDRHIEQLTTASEHCDLAIKVAPLPRPALRERLKERSRAASFEVLFSQIPVKNECLWESHTIDRATRERQEPCKFLLGWITLGKVITSTVKITGFAKKNDNFLGSLEPHYFSMVHPVAFLGCKIKLEVLLKL